MKKTNLLLLLLACLSYCVWAEERTSTRLLHAAASGDMKATRTALESCDLEAKNGEDRTALHLAAAKGHRSVVDLLLSEGANVGALDYRGQASLHLAAAGGHYAACKSLLKGGADPNIADGKGDTPLHSAAAGGHMESTRTLLEFGAKASTKNTKRATAADRAERSKVGSWRNVQFKLKQAVAEEG